MAESSKQDQSLEDLRKLHEFGTLQRFKLEAEETLRLELEAKMATNAANRQGTQLKNALVAIVKREDLKAEDEIRLGALAYRYDYATSEVVPAEALLKLFEDGEIDRRQFIESIKVQKADAERVIGGLIIGKLTETAKGDKADVRKRKLEDSEVTTEPKLIRAKPEQTVASTKPVSPATIKQRPGKSLGGIRKRPRW